MHSEIEAKFTDVNIHDIRKQLEAAGAVCEQPLRLMRRAVFHNPLLVEKDAFVRVRDEGNRVTMTYKQFDDADSIHGVRELEVTVSDFEHTISLLEQTGLSNDTYQETRRETWKIGDVEVVVDEWPWINPFIEIEGPSEAAVQSVAATLGFSWDDAVFGGVASVYVRSYTSMGDRAAEIINRQTPVIRFEDPVPHSFLGSQS